MFLHLQVFLPPPPYQLLLGSVYLAWCIQLGRHFISGGFCVGERERAVDQKTQEPTFEAYCAEVISNLDLINSARGSGPGWSCGFLAELSRAAH